MATGAGRARQALVSPAMQASAPSLPRMAGPPAAPRVPVISNDEGVQALTDGFDKLLGAVVQDQQNRDNLKRIELEQEFQTNAAAKAAGLDPMTVDYDKLVVQAYTEAGQATEEKARDLFHSQQPALQLSARIAEATGQAERAAIVARREAVGNMAEMQYNKSALETLAAIRKDPDSEDIYLNRFAETSRDIVPGLKPGRAPVLGLAFAQDAIIAKAEGFALKGRYDEARKFADESASALTGDAHRNLKRRITEVEDEHRRNYHASTEALMANHEVAIYKAATLSELDDIERQINAQDDAGIFQGRQGFRATLIGRIESRRDAIVRETRALNTALAKYESGTGLDNQDEADYAWSAVAAKLPQDLPLDVTLDHLTRFANNTGWVPSRFKRLVENAERVSRPELLASAAQIYDAVRKSGASPSVDIGVSKDGSRVVLASAMHNLTGMSYDAVAQYVTDNLPDNATLTARREQFKKDFASFKTGDYLVNNIEGADKMWPFANAGVDPAAANEFERSLAMFYELSGDKAVAERAALQRFSAIYGVTGIGDGHERITKLPPERFFPGASNGALNVDQKRSIVDTDVRRTLKDYGITPAIVIGDKEDTSGIRDFELAADPQTEREVGAGRVPSYELRVRNNAGALVPVWVTLDDGTRTKLRYNVPNANRLIGLPEYRALVEAEEAKARGGMFYFLPEGLRPKAPDFNLDRRGPILGTRDK